MEVEWLPFLLRPDTPPEGIELPSYVQARMKVVGDRLHQIAAAIGLPMTTHSRIPNSRRALECAEYAREQGRHDAFHPAVFLKYWGAGEDISVWAPLRTAAVEAGLDADAMQRAVETGRYRSLVDTHMAQAQMLGITGVPTYILDDKYAIVGAQPYEVFERVLVRLAQEQGH